MKGFYHSSDMDGICSAAILNYVYGDRIELIGINYGDEFPWDSISKKEKIYMADFSLQPFSNMIRLNDVAFLIWIDHHKSAIEEMNKSDTDFYGIQKIGLGACALVWEYFHNTELNPVPRTIQYLAYYDVWDHSDPNTLYFQ